MLFVVAVPVWGQGAPAEGLGGGVQTGSERAPPVAAGEAVTELDKSITVIHQASDGAYWFGSKEQGVYRWDGTSLVRFTTAHGLGGGHVRGIQEDGAGNILVATDPGGVSRFDGRAFDPAPLADKGEWRLQDGDLWFVGCTNTGEVYRWDGTLLHRLTFPKTAAGDAHYAAFPREQYPGMKYSPYDVYTIFKDSRGHIWFGTGTLGACRYDGKTFAWVDKTDVGYGPSDSFGMRSITEFRDGKFWFGNTKNRFGVEAEMPGGAGAAGEGPETVALRFTREAGTEDAAGAEEGGTVFVSALKDKDGDLWLATLGGAVWRYDGKKMTRYLVTHEGGGGGEPVWLFSIAQDRAGGLWVGTQGGGVYKWNGEGFEPVKF